MLYFCPNKNKLKRKINIQSLIVRFTRWSRNNWAIFASLNYEVQIGFLKTCTINLSLIKSAIFKIDDNLYFVNDSSQTENDKQSIPQTLNIFNFSEIQFIIQNNLLNNIELAYSNNNYITKKVLKNVP